MRIYTKLQVLKRYRELSAEKITSYEVCVLSCDFKAYKWFNIYSRWKNSDNQEYVYAIKFSSLSSLLPPSFISWHQCQSRRMPLSFMFFPISMSLPAPINISSVPAVVWPVVSTEAANYRGTKKEIGTAGQPNLNLMTYTGIQISPYYSVTCTRSCISCATINSYQHDRT